MPTVSLVKLCILAQSVGITFMDFNQISDIITNAIKVDRGILYALGVEGEGVSISLFAVKA